jgi:hypothetical protein
MLSPFASLRFPTDSESEQEGEGTKQGREILLELADVFWTAVFPNTSKSLRVMCPSTRSFSRLGIYSARVAIEREREKRARCPEKG